MLSAVLDDFGRLAEVETLTLFEEHFEHDVRHGVCRRIQALNEEKAFRELASRSDFTLIIAPELNGILETRCRWALDSGGQLLGPSLAGVQLTADKLALSRHFRENGVPSPECRSFIPGEEVPHTVFPLVWKPRFGAGSQATYLVQDPQELPACVDRARSEGWEGEALLQPLLPGMAASVAFLTGPRACIPLLPAAQRLSDDGRFQYLGGSLPLPDHLSARAVQVAVRALETIPRLRGYVGVDVILGHAEDGSSDAVIEVNPRLTTSYVGLRTLAESNLAEALLRIALGEDSAHLLWRPGVVDFDADGTVRWQS
jgi:predicted ATP-grasp superfamily ATP-dependent carboligase